MIGSLTTYEMKLKPKKKDTGIALKVETECDTDTTEESLLDETLAMITMKFQWFIKESFKKNIGKREGSNNYTRRNQDSKG